MLVFGCLAVLSVCVCVCVFFVSSFFFFQAEDGIRDLVRSRGLGDVYKRQLQLKASGRSGFSNVLVSLLSPFTGIFDSMASPFSSQQLFLPLFHSQK